MGVFVGLLLPGMVWVTNVYLNVDPQREACMVGHLLASVPGEERVHLPGELLRLLDQGIDHRLGVFAGDFDPHQIAGMTFDQRRHLAGVAIEEQTSLPVPR